MLGAEVRRPGAAGSRPAALPLVLLLGVSSGLLLVSCGDSSKEDSIADRPNTIHGPIQNVLLIVVDTLRADHLGCYGYPRDTSPNIDALAASAVRFDRAFTAWPETAPSMAAMLTSSHGQSNGVVRRTPNMVPDGLLMISEVLAAVGARTGAIVTNAVLDRNYRFDQGFDDYLQEWEQNRWRTAADVCDWLEDYGHDRPFFLWAHFMEPHAPYSPPKAFAERYVGDEHYDGSRTATVNEGEWDAFGGFPAFSRLEGQPAHDDYLARYDGEIRWSDEKVGTILEKLEELGLANSTLVIFTADHGEGFGEHDYYWHGQTPYNEGARVPLIIRLPGGGAGKVADEPVSTIDIGPTILEALGLSVPASFQGYSLHGRLQGTEEAVERDVFSESGGVEQYQQSIIRGPWKLVDVRSSVERSNLTGAPYELYNLEQDFDEKVNLVDRHPEVFQDLKRRLEQWRDSAVILARPEALRELSGDDRDRVKALGYSVPDRPDEDR